MLDWLDALPDMRVADVQHVQPQKTDDSVRTTADVQPCARTDVHLRAQPRTSDNVRAEPAEIRDCTRRTSRTQPDWDSLVTQPDPVSRDDAGAYVHIVCPLAGDPERRCSLPGDMGRADGRAGMGRTGPVLVFPRTGALARQIELDCPAPRQARRRHDGRSHNHRKHGRSAPSLPSQLIPVPSEGRDDLVRRCLQP